MTAQTEAMRAAEFILSEANGKLSREVFTADGAIDAGELVYSASDGSCKPWPGTGTADGVAYAAAADNAEVVVLVRMCEVKGSALTLPAETDEDDARTALAGTDNVIVR